MYLLSVKVNGVPMIPLAAELESPLLFDVFPRLSPGPEAIDGHPLPDTRLLYQNSMNYTDQSLGFAGSGIQYMANLNTLPASKPEPLARGSRSVTREAWLYLRLHVSYSVSYVGKNGAHLSLD